MSLVSLGNPPDRMIFGRYGKMQLKLNGESTQAQAPPGRSDQAGALNWGVEPDAGQFGANSAEARQSPWPELKP
ncbi:hypothetical protein [Bosea sp. CRIB-10]|uniref:hypothetical protein n=1 Tax=Bosea sp. CRIB-10 TaxID=378404 RepID=UPI0011138443|nr:hypothetical protein [Bosea sp. CRIB-10]